MSQFVNIGTRIFNADFICSIDFEVEDPEQPGVKYAEVNLLNGETIFFYEEELALLKLFFSIPGITRRLCKVPLKADTN